MENWNKNEWQGRSKRQVEDSGKMISYIVISLTSYLILKGLVHLLGV